MSPNVDGSWPKLDDRIGQSREPRARRLGPLIPLHYWQAFTMCLRLSSLTSFMNWPPALRKACWGLRPQTPAQGYSLIFIHFSLSYTHSTLSPTPSSIHHRYSFLLRQQFNNIFNFLYLTHFNSYFHHLSLIFNPMVSSMSSYYNP